MVNIPYNAPVDVVEWMTRVMWFNCAGLNRVLPEGLGVGHHQDQMKTKQHVFGSYYE